MPVSLRWLGLVVTAIFAGAVHGQSPPSASARVDFNRDIRPILSGRCSQCHGPDEKARKAGLRLDVRATAIKELKSGNRAIVPGDPANSELIARVTSDDADGMMPPAKSGKRLSDAEVALLRRWIEQGANYAVHWSYARPVRAPQPAVVHKPWPNNPVDCFILARLEKAGLTPAAAADRYAILRRLSLDLTGLPPTLAAADAFANDKSPDAYEKVVDHLLASESFGERWATVWLDLARYADSQGYANDPDRTIWRWRDWVIEALNQNMPFDRFTIEQLAGDMLSNPTPAQLIATGFHRNTLTNTEGGTSVEEFRSAAVADRVVTTMQVWMGTTINCCQCHNHKYDPLSQKEFYQLYAILNNTEDNNGGDDAPFLKVAVSGREQEFVQLNERLTKARQALEAEGKKIDAQMARIFPALISLLSPTAAAAVKRDPKWNAQFAQTQRMRSEHWKKLSAEERDLLAKTQAISTTTPVLREGKPRATHVHLRGNYLDKGDAVTPGLPAAFPAPPAGAVINRLTLAKWLVSPDNPLTARVAVNRLWEELFGVGIVETSEEFGMQGELPTHPELLDWLATEYVRLGWDTKKFLKLLVMSAAYRQSSQATPERLQKDPYNRLLSRGPRVRLSAEAVRDQALFAAGLLSTKMFGPPVQPPKPNFGLTAAFGGSTDWQPSAGEDKYRRALYTRIRRNAPYPAMTTFDAPERTHCNIRRIRTNTPLQALVTLNDPVYIEAAQALARRVAAHAGDAKERATIAFRLVLTRPPGNVEVARLQQVYERAREQFRKDGASATALATKPLGPLPGGADAAELAAWTVVGNVLLNLDEALAKP